MKPLIKIGDKFKSPWETYTLVQVGHGKVCAVGESSANRYKEPIKVKNIENISDKELKGIFGDIVSNVLWERKHNTVA